MNNMKVVIQRCRQASVSVDNNPVSNIGYGMMILVGIAVDDTKEDVSKMAKKISNLRIFNDEKGVMNYSITDIAGEIMAVSQFTLLANTKKGNRPSYINAARPETATKLYDLFCDEIAKLCNISVAKGIFGADMQVSLINDGPVTIVIDSSQFK